MLYVLGCSGPSHQIHVASTGEVMNQSRPVGVALVIIGTLFVVTALGAQPPRKLELVMGIALILAAVVQAIRAR